ncbi:MAG TPA: IMP cyclohydrolase [Terriglobales bacterium]|nr:IMP cyclohydrolase [Terriglobales bacterium]
MTEATPSPAALEYPGRLIILGTATNGRRVVVYAITGRSPSSQARALVFRDRGVWVRPTDEETLRKGNIDLLVYPAVLFDDRGVAVSNGRQTADIASGLAASGDPVAVLAGALAKWDYEPDAPIFTPRISGCLAGGRAGLSLVRRGPDGATLRSYFEVTSRPGAGRLVSTYEGPNREPLPSFEGEPRDARLEGATARETVEAVYEALAPRAGGRDFRVAAACAFIDPAKVEGFDLHIINRHERT